MFMMYDILVFLTIYTVTIERNQIHPEHSDSTENYQLAKVVIKGPTIY